jgi:hypothetical protein
VSANAGELPRGKPYPTAGFGGAMSPETVHPQGVTQSGEIVRLEYDLWGEGGGRTDLIDTTHEEVAQGAKVPVAEGQR